MANLALNIHLLLVLFCVGTELLDPGINALRCYTQPMRNFGTAVTPINGLANCFLLKFFVVTLVADKHLSSCHY